MAIKVAKHGYAGTSIPGHALLLIDGELHRDLHPVNRNEPLWVPVAVYEGDVEYVDIRGRPMPLDPDPAPGRGGRGRGAA